MTESTPPPNGIYWLASYPKSGNTWVRIFIQNLLNLVRGDPVDGDQINDLPKYSVAEAREENFKPFVEKADSSNWRQVASVRPKVQEALVRRAGNSIFVKTHLAALDVIGVPLINSAVTRGATYVIRNPLDVAVSLAAHLGSSIDRAIEIMGDPGHHTPNGGDGQVFEVWSSWSRHVESWTKEAHSALLVLRYEDMTAKPLDAFAAFIKHTGLRPTFDQFTQAVELSAFDRVRDQEAKWGFHERPEQSSEPFFRKGQVGSWRDTLSNAQVKRILIDHGTEMARFGYSDA